MTNNEATDSGGLPHLSCRLQGSPDTNELSREHAAISSDTKIRVHLPITGSPLPIPELCVNTKSPRVVVPSAIARIKTSPSGGGQ